jgi:hypothetical protein
MACVMNLDPESCQIRLNNWQPWRLPRLPCYPSTPPLQQHLRLEGCTVGQVAGMAKSQEPSLVACMPSTALQAEQQLGQLKGSLQEQQAVTKQENLRVRDTSAQHSQRQGSRERQKTC